MQLFFYLISWLVSFFEAFGIELLFLVVLLLFGVLIAGVMAPLGALGWWENSPDVQQQGQKLAEKQTPEPTPLQQALSKPTHYLVYLSGIGDISGDYLNQREFCFIEALQTTLPYVHIIHDIFAFSVSNVGLTEEPMMGRFWRWMKQIKLQERRTAALGGMMINGRNLLQVTVSADRRYGPVFNYGMANTIYQNLLRAGFQPASGIPITLLGYSGGGQVVLGSAQYLKPALQSPLQVISLGGVMADSLGIEAADQIVHLQGELDSVQRLGDYLFPLRWPIAHNSHWNQALATGKLRRVITGPMQHSGPHSYFDSETFLDNRQSYLDSTVARVVNLIEAFHAKYTE